MSARIGVRYYIIFDPSKQLSSNVLRLCQQPLSKFPTGRLRGL
jgi:hypothetical protein